MYLMEYPDIYVEWQKRDVSYGIFEKDEKPPGFLEGAFGWTEK